MQQTLVTIGMLAGGLGLFMLAVSMITDGLKPAAGPALRQLLSKWTRSPLRGIFTGIAITGIVQSSSAVTVATIGFVNAGLISMRQALGIVYGSNIGTTMTGWLVAVVGFGIDVDAFALPLIGIGMLLRLTGGESKRAPFGLTLVGFGLFFIGIDVLKDAFDGLLLTIDLNGYSEAGIWSVLIYVGIGFLMTVLTQSSSAAIAIIFTAAAGGVLGLNAAAAMIIGANVGTTSTAGIAVIGATANAKRVACAHIIFNVGTAVIALLALPVLFWIVQKTEQLLGLEAIPVVTLALFHTFFNISGVLLIFPLNSRLASFLEKRFVTQEEVEGRPRYLDKTVAVSPPLAINALALELARVTTIVRRMGLEALNTELIHGKQLASDHVVVHKLSGAVSKFISRLERSLLSKEVSAQLALVLRAEQHLLASGDHALLIAKAQSDIEDIEDRALMEPMTFFYVRAVKLMEMADPADSSFSYAECDLELDRMQQVYEDVKEALLAAGVALRIPIPAMIDILDQNSRIRKMLRQLVKAMHYLSELSVTTDTEVKDAEQKPELEQEQEPDIEQDEIDAEIDRSAGFVP
ncbi:MAG: Na/Pi cotransporter family protein [Pseudomonadales bacterium]